MNYEINLKNKNKPKYVEARKSMKFTIVPTWNCLGMIMEGTWIVVKLLNLLPVDVLLQHNT